MSVGTSCMDKNTGSGYKSCHSFPSLSNGVDAYAYINSELVDYGA